MDSRLEKILDYYRDKYEMNYDAEVFGMPVPYLAKRSDRQEKTVLGFRMGKERYGPEASEYVFIFKYDALTGELQKQIETLLASAEKEYVKPSRDHGFTFLTAIAAADKIDDDAAALIKKFKLSHNYHLNGFTMARIAALSPDGKCVCSKDGKDLKRLIEKNILGGASHGQKQA